MARSFDFGSVESNGKKSMPLAFAQDDGLLFENFSGGLCEFL